MLIISGRGRKSLPSGGRVVVRLIDCGTGSETRATGIHLRAALAPSRSTTMRRGIPIFAAILVGWAALAADDPARLARIRAAKMPKLDKPVAFDTPEADAICSALEVFPPDNPWNQLVEDWPLHPSSAKIVAAVGRDKPFR